MGAPKGRAGGNAGKGRPKGALNKVTRDIKEMVVGALMAEGGVKYLRQQARDNPTAFMALCGRVMPLQLTGDATAPIVIQLVRYDGAGHDSNAEIRQAAPPAFIEADQLVPVLSLPQPASSPTLPAGAKDVGSETLRGEPSEELRHRDSQRPPLAASGSGGGGNSGTELYRLFTGPRAI
jgi:hypothetical protein